MPDNLFAGGFAPHEAQRRVLGSDARFVNICKSRQSGGTRCAVPAFTARIFRDYLEGKGTNRPLGTPTWEIPRLHYRIVAPFSGLYEQAKNFFQGDFPEEWRQSFYANGTKREYRGRPQFWLPGDILVEFVTGEKPGNLVSRTLDGVLITEAAKLRRESWHELRPALEARQGWCITDTVPTGKNWWHEEFWLRGEPSSPTYDPAYENHHWTWEAAPWLSHLHAERERCRNAGGVLWAWFRREWEANFDVFHGQIFPLGDQHVFHGPVGARLYRRRIGGYDWGRGPGAGVLVILGERSDGGHDVVHEVYEHGRAANWWCRAFEEVIREWGVERIWVDPSCPIIPDLEGAGLPIEYGTTPEVRDVNTGIERVASRLSTEGPQGPLLRVHSRCANTLRELTGYRWAESGVGDRPLKVDDHAADAIRYALVNDLQGVPYWVPR